jgi:hypothetical protein
MHTLSPRKRSFFSRRAFPPFWAPYFIFIHVGSYKKKNARERSYRGDPRAGRGAPRE